MNRAKVLFSYFEGNFIHKKLSLRKNIEIAFSCVSVKIKPFSNLSAMEDFYAPPSSVRGMTKLDRNAFKKTIKVPCLTGESSKMRAASSVFKNYFLKIHNLKPLQEMENDMVRLLLDPKKISCLNDFDSNTLEQLKHLNIAEDNFSEVPVELGYDNWTSETLLRAILPKDLTPLTSYSMIGHIIQLNIREQLLDYKNVMAEILLEKHKNCRTVIRKEYFIDNIYRNSEVEILCGEPNLITRVFENLCQFELDLSKVYWNPRLGSEHKRIVEEIEERDVLFDVFAGVGPFAIPAAKKKCVVYANDLNPESIKWLNHSTKLNKRTKDYITTFNKDGKDFILDDVKENLLKIWQDDLFISKIHVVMNLPVLAPTFIKYFNKLISKSDLVNTNISQVKKCLPIINCYYFVSRDDCQKTVFEESSGMNLSNIEHTFHFVRSVSNEKSMVRVTFSMPFEYLVDEEEGVDRVVERDEPLAKRICTE